MEHMERCPICREQFYRSVGPRHEHTASEWEKYKADLSTEEPIQGGLEPCLACGALPCDQTIRSTPLVLDAGAIEVLRAIATIPTVGTAGTRADDDWIEVRGFAIEGAHHFVRADIIDKARAAVALIDATGN